MYFEYFGRHSQFKSYVLIWIKSDLEDVDFKNFLSAQPWWAPNFLGKKPTGYKFLISTTVSCDMGLYAHIDPYQNRQNVLCHFFQFLPYGEGCFEKAGNEGLKATEHSTTETSFLTFSFWKRIMATPLLGSFYGPSITSVIVQSNQ